MRHVAVAVLLAAVLLSSSASRAQASPEQDFWGWFQKNDAMLFDFEKNREKTFDLLSTEMKKVNPALVFEFGPVTNGKREFVISADGIITAFPAVERLYDSAPRLDHWTWVKFRPRRTPMDVEYDGVKVQAADVFCTVEPDGDKAGLTFYIHGYQAKNEKAYRGIAFLMLDQALGEYDVETKVGFIEIKDDSEKSPLEKKPLKELSKSFDSFIASCKKSA